MAKLGEIVAGIFAAYIITAVLVNGNIFYSTREWIKKKTPWLVKGAPGEQRHMINCRMCVGFWVALGVFCTMYPLPYVVFFLLYGASYFLATQER
jgi:hypothetical protein